MLLYDEPIDLSYALSSKCRDDQIISNIPTGMSLFSCLATIPQLTVDFMV